MSTSWSRRDILKTMGLGIAGFSVPPFSRASAQPESFEPVWEHRHRPLAKPVTAITLGAGARGNVYGNFAAAFTDQLDIVGVAEPIAIRNERYAAKHHIADENRFSTWEHVFDRPKFADAVIITTPDDLHYGPCMAALDLGYDILLEKPISPSEQECRDILRKTQETGRIVAVCHVLRYAPYFQKLQALLDTGAIGEIVSMQHFEPIEHVHMAHSFVRGNWHDSVATSPIILAKSCHDLDIMRWLLGRQSQRIAAFGDLKWFKSDNAPEGSTARCLDGCAVEASCPYSAKRIYLDRGSYLYVFDLPDNKAEHPAAITEYLRTTDYGRCVYRMDNDQPDHYVCAMEFEGGVTASFNMEAFTSYHGRRTRVMGAMGDIVGDMNTFTLTDFRTREARTFDNTAEDVENYRNSGHGGGDWRLVADWVQAVDQRDPTLLTSTIEASIESHLMAFAAEKSRLGAGVVTIEL